jgi:N12 class adenine-specific DNA methylase
MSPTQELYKGHLSSTLFETSSRHNLSTCSVTKVPQIPLSPIDLAVREKVQMQEEKDKAELMQRLKRKDRQKQKLQEKEMKDKKKYFNEKQKLLEEKRAKAITTIKDKQRED